MTETPPDQWEYHVEMVPVDNLHPRGTKRRIEVRLNELGREGWELVSATTRSQLGTDHLEYTFKRRRVE